MSRDLRCRVNREVAARKTFEKSFDIGSARTCHQSSNLFEDGFFVGSMEAVAIERPAEVIRRGNEELPEHFRFPGGQCFGVDGVNIRIGEKSQPLETLQRADVFSESRNNGRIKNVAALDGCGHVQVMLNQEAGLGFFFLRKAEALRGGCE